MGAPKNSSGSRRGEAIARPYIERAREFLQKCVKTRHGVTYGYVKARQLARAIGVSAQTAGVILTILPEWRQGGSRCNRTYEFVGGLRLEV